MKDDDDREASSCRLLPTSWSSSTIGAEDYTYSLPSNTPKTLHYRNGLRLSLFKRPLSKGCVFLFLLLIGFLAFWLSPESWIRSPRNHQVEGWRWRRRPKASAGLVKVGGRRLKNESYTDNLLPDINYITSFSIDGLNNEVITTFNLLHLTSLLRNNPSSPYPYTPLLPPFFPHFSHLGGNKNDAAPVLRFSQVFDIDRLAENLKFGIVEWADLKEGFAGEGGGGRIEDEWLDEEGRERERKEVLAGTKKLERMGSGLTKEVLPCWSTWMTMHKGNQVGPALGAYYNFRTSYTPLPPSLFSQVDYGGGMRSLLLPNTANFLSPPENRLQSDYLDFRRSDEADRNIASWGKNMTREDVFGEKSGWVKPNTKKGGLTCFDLLYYASDKGEEVRQVYKATPPVPREQGAWWSIGQHAHWTPELRMMGVNTLRRVIGLPEGKAIPDVFTVHIRRTDFLAFCPAYALPCLAVSHYADHINGMRERYINNGTREASSWPVVVTTDELDPAYLAEIAALEWFLIDHQALKTRQIHGIWYPSLLDVVILSLGRGFVGTKGSTMSILASRRVEDWNGGKAERIGRLESKWPYDPKVDYTLID